MHRERTSFVRGEKMEKLPMGPTSSRPGPMLPIQATTAVKVVPKEKLSRATSSVAPKVMSI